MLRRWRCVEKMGERRGDGCCFEGQVENREVVKTSLKIRVFLTHMHTHLSFIIL